MLQSLALIIEIVGPCLRFAFFGKSKRKKEKERGKYIGADFDFHYGQVD